MATRKSAWVVCVLGVISLGAGGCFQIDEIFGNATGTVGSIPNDPDNTPINEFVPAVTLAVSNPTPVLGENVTLSCTVTNGAPGPLTFNFAPDNLPFPINQNTNTATFIVDETSLGFVIDFSCRASNAFGQSEPSSVVTVAPPQVEVPIEGGE